MHPDYPGAPTKGGKTTQQVIDAFVEDPKGMHLVAQALWRSGNLSRDDHDDVGDPQYAPVGETTAAFVSAVEGRIIERLVKVAERNPKLRKAKIQQSRQERGTIACEVCGFDFERAYGQLGEGYIHVHQGAAALHGGDGEQTRGLDPGVCQLPCDDPPSFTMEDTRPAEGAHRRHNSVIVSTTHFSSDVDLINRTLSRIMTDRLTSAVRSATRPEPPSEKY